MEKQFLTPMCNLTVHANWTHAVCKLITETIRLVSGRESSM